MRVKPPNGRGCVHASLCPLVSAKLILIPVVETYHLRPPGIRGTVDGCALLEHFWRALDGQRFSKAFVKEQVPLFVKAWQRTKLDLTCVGSVNVDSLYRTCVALFVGENGVSLRQTSMHASVKL